MILAELIARYRAEAFDTVVPYFVSDEQVALWLNDAVAEAAIRGRLIHESSSSMCRTAVTPGKSVYAINQALYELTHTAFRQTGCPRRAVKIVSEEWLDANVAEWRDLEGNPEFCIQSDKSLRLIPVPDKDGDLLLEGYRLPIASLEINDLEAAPEIHHVHHRHLVLWVLHRAFSVPDAEQFDQSRAALAEQEFTGYFGMRPDSDLRRITREDVNHHVTPHWI